jgi:hypothetical protein
MDNPRAVPQFGQSPGQLRSAYAGEQRGRSVRRHARGGFATVKGVLVGAALAGAAVFAFCVLTHQALVGLAGGLLCRTAGGPIAGGVLFGLAYSGALFLRESKYNSITVLEPFLPHREVTLHGDFAMLASLAVCGALIGYFNSLK